MSQRLPTPLTPAHLLNEGVADIRSEPSTETIPKPNPTLLGRLFLAIARQRAREARRIVELYPGKGGIAGDGQQGR